MRRVVIPLFFLTFLAHDALGQSHVGQPPSMARVGRPVTMTHVGQEPVREIAGVRHAVWKGSELTPGGRPDHGSMLWNNMAIRGYWTGADTGYINLDWGKLPVPASGLPDHVIDGFTFRYGTNNYSLEDTSIGVFFFDSCTGWSNLGVAEAAFLFSGLPNGYLPGT